MSDQEARGGPHPPDDEIDLMEIVKVIYRSRWLIVLLTTVVMLGALGFSLAKERMYEASATFVVQADRLRVGPLGAGERPVDTGVALTILRSRQVADRVIDSMQLVLQWRAEGRAAALERLQSHTTIRQERQGGTVFTISFRDPSPTLARDVVASYIEHFVEIMESVNVTEADRALEFIESRLQEVELQMHAAEAALRDFETEHHITSLSDQVKSLVEARARLQDRVRNLEMQRAAKSTYLTQFDPEMQQIQAELEAAIAQLRALDMGESDEAPALSAGGSSGTLALRRIPEISLELARLQREVRIRREMYELLRQQQEAARIESAKKLHLARIIDYPQVPERPVSRRAALNVALAAVLGGFASLFVAFILHYVRNRPWDEATLRELPFLRHLAR